MPNKPESQILQECRLKASELGAIVWRNNTGAYKDKGRYVRYGLCVGSSDLIGIYRGKFIAIECKAQGKKPTPEQISFINAVNNAGGIAGVCYSAEDVAALLNKITIPTQKTQ